MGNKKWNRRQFLIRVKDIGLGAAGLALMTACGVKPTPELVRVATQAPGPSPTEPPATATLAPTEVISPTSSPTATAVPTQPSSATATPARASTATATPAPAYLAVARGPDPAEITRRAIAALGGIERFLKPGANVIIKPNICNAYHGMEFASTTNPTVVGTLVALCVAAGAKSVRVMDYPFGGTPQASYAKSGIADAVKAAGGEMVVMSQVKFRSIDIPKGRRIQKWTVYGDILDADLVINVPIAKDHAATRLTLGMKNLMGVIEDRAGFHSRGLHQCIADLNTVVRPQLTVVDAVRILMDNGPTGGNLADVKKMDTVIASTDVVAADAYAATLFDLKPADIGYIRLGDEMGIGKMDLKSIRIEEITV